MESKTSIICVAMTTWEGDYIKSTVKLMEALSTRARVLFVNYQYTWKDVIWALLGKSPAPLQNILGFKPRISQQGNVSVLTPGPVIPINWIRNRRIHAWLNKVNGWIAARAIKKAQRQLGMLQPTMINAFNPVMGTALMGILPTKATYYYCYDDISQSHWCKNHGPAYEKQFAKHVDGIFVSSKALQDKFQALHSNVAWIPNGVDFELFGSAFSVSGRKRSAELHVVFLGSLDFRVDFDLLTYLAKKLPRVHFDLVGRVLEKSKVRDLTTFPNVTVHGPQQPDNLPSFLSRADVGIIPFIRNEFTRSIYPMKINEYLAAGLPVVATDFADLTGFESVVWIAKRKVDFLMCLARSLETDSIELQNQRRNIAQSNDWQGRAASFWAFHHQKSLAS